jgi:hypothetical protein
MTKSIYKIMFIEKILLLLEDKTTSTTTTTIITISTSTSTDTAKGVITPVERDSQPNTQILIPKLLDFQKMENLSREVNGVNLPYALTSQDLI